MNKNIIDLFLNDIKADKIQLSENEITKETKRLEKSEKKYKKRIMRALHKRRAAMMKEECLSILSKKKRSKPFDLSTTTKQIMLFIVINCTIIELYAMIVMAVFRDLIALDALISAVVAESFTFLVYCMKSYLETRSEKTHEYEMEKLRYENESDEDNYQEDPELKRKDET